MSTRRAPAGEEGSVLLLVLMSVLFVSLVLVTAVGLAVANLKPAGTDQQAKAATAAAQAGISDYLARLNSSTDYWTDNGVDAANPAFLTASSTTGRLIPGTTASSYSYSVLTTATQTAATSIVRLASTGRSGTVSRTLTATLQSKGFLQYLYQTDKETLDPSLLGLSTSGEAACDQYWYAGRSSASGCSDIGFSGGDVIAGPVHTNDTILLNGAATFKSSQTESSWPTPTTKGQYWRSASGTSYAPATCTGCYKPVYADVVQIPTTNSELASAADNSGAAGGCTYVGATKIIFSGTSMTVLSPNTTSAPTRCYNTATRTTAQTISPIPPVIYVSALNGACSTTGLGYPLSGEYVGNGNANVSASYTGPMYTCAEGTAYVQGTLDGAVTIGTAQDIVITGNLTYADESADSDDALGLIPSHYAWVYHPVKLSCNSASTSASCYTNMLATPITKIDAAILAVQDSFIVQNHKLGSAALTTSTSTKLNVYGSIAQKFRGPVGTGNGTTATTGYLKAYSYDSRFATGLQPPYFLQPVAAQWKSIQVSAG